MTTEGTRDGAGPRLYPGDSAAPPGPEKSGTAAARAEDRPLTEPAETTGASRAPHEPAGADRGREEADDAVAGGAADPAPGEARAGYGRLFGVAEFRAVFVAHAASLFGVVVAEISLSVLVYRLSGSPLLSALTFALGFLPYAIGGTLLSGIADRYPPRRVLVVCDLLCAGCALLMALPVTPVAALLALRFLIALVSPVFNGTRMATLTDVLGDGDLFVLGRSLLRIVSQSAVLGGLALGGVLLTVVPPRGALAITVVTFLCSAVLLRLGTRRRPARTQEPRALIGHSLAGLRQLFAHRRLRALVLLLWVPPLFSVVPEVLAAAYADDIGAGTSAVGLLMCAMAVGTIGGELLAGSLLSPAARARIALPLACLTLLPLVGYAVTPGLAATLPLLLLSGLGFAYTLGVDRWFVDELPEELRGRAMTVHNAGLMTVQGIGAALAGVAAESFGVAAAVTAAGVLGTVCCTALALEVRASARARRSKSETGLTTI